MKKLLQLQLLDTLHVQLKIKFKSHFLITTFFLKSVYTALNFSEHVITLCKNDQSLLKTIPKAGEKSLVN